MPICGFACKWDSVKDTLNLRANPRIEIADLRIASVDVL